MFVHHQFCTSSLQYFTVHLYEASSRWHETNHSWHTVSCLYRTPPDDRQFYLFETRQRINWVKYIIKKSVHLVGLSHAYAPSLIPPRLLDFEYNSSFVCDGSCFYEYYTVVYVIDFSNLLSVTPTQSTLFCSHGDNCSECEVYMRTVHHQAV